MKKLVSVLLSLVLFLVPAAAAFALDAHYETPYENSEFFDYGEYSIHYRVIPADNEKDHIMMLHGFAESTYAWQNMAELLAAEGYSCVLVDLPDFGYSSRETKDTNKLPREEIIHALMAELSADPWILAGHSMGGYVALAVAQTYPESVKTLLLYGTSGNDGNAGGAIMSNDIFASVMGRFMELMGRSKLLVRLLLRVAIQDNAYVDNYDLDAMIAPFRIDGTGAGAIYNFSMLTATDYEAVSKMPPILFMNGDKDKVIADNARKNLRAALPAGSLDYIVRGGGHMFIENMAGEAASVTLDFLNK